MVELTLAVPVQPGYLRQGQGQPSLAKYEISQSLKQFQGKTLYGISGILNKFE